MTLATPLQCLMIVDTIDCDTRACAHYLPAKVGIMIIRPAMVAILFIGMKYGLLMYQ